MRGHHKRFRRDFRKPPAASSHPSAVGTALIIFTKAPIPGQVKTRLCPPLTHEEAATLHGSFVLDMVERSEEAITHDKLVLDRIVACSPAPDHAFFKFLGTRHRVRLLPQVGEDLGARMHHVFQASFALGYQRVLMIGTDLPLLPRNSLKQAIALLGDHDLVLGPATDGGYYAMGLTRPIQALFVGIPWSTDHVASLTLQRAKHAGLRTALLPELRDIDRMEDLEVLINERASTPSLSRRTADVLHMLSQRIREREGWTVGKKQ